MCRVHLERRYPGFLGNLGFQVKNMMDDRWMDDRRMCVVCVIKYKILN